MHTHRSKRRAAILLAIISILMVACQSAPSTDTVAECYVRYLKPEGQSLAEITVRQPNVKGKLRSVEVPGGMRYRGVLMRVAAVGDVIAYRSEGGATYALDHDFRWKDDKGQSYEVRMQMLPVFEPSWGGRKLSLRKPATFTWHGPPIGEKEAWVFLWERTDQPEVVSMDVVVTPGADRIEFPAAQLAKLQPGRWTYYVVRKKAFQQQQSGLRWQGIAEYYSDVDTVQIEE